MVAYAAQVPAGPERTDVIPPSRPLGVWLRLRATTECRQLKPACTRASSAVCSRLLPSCSRSLPTSRSPLTPGAPSCSRTTPTVLTPLILGTAPQLPGCKRLHLTFGSSWAAKSVGRDKSQILSSTGGSGGPTHTWSCPPLPGCKRLHLTFGPSWAAKSIGQATTQIASGWASPNQKNPAPRGTLRHAPENSRTQDSRRLACFCVGASATILSTGSVPEKRNNTQEPSSNKHLTPSIVLIDSTR